jgi:hypothetical protein
VVKRLLLLLGLVLALPFVMADSGSCGSSQAPAQSSAAAADTTPAAGATPSKAPAAPQTLLDISGSGTKSTQTFAAHGNWDMTWTYDCTSFGANGNFIVEVYNQDNTLNFDNQGVNQLGAKGASVEHYHAGGTFYLKIDSECNWTVKITG